MPGFRLGIYIFKDAEIVDFAAPYGVFSVARRFDPELDVFFVAESLRPVQAQAGFTVLPNYSFADRPAMDAFLIPGGFGTRQEMHNRRLHEYIRSLPEATLLTSVCTGSWVYGKMGLLDGLPATNRKEPDRLEASDLGKVPLDRLAEIAPACRISRARVVDAGRIITAGGIASGMEMGFHLLRRAGYAERVHRRGRAGHGVHRRLRGVQERPRASARAVAPRRRPRAQSSCAPAAIHRRIASNLVGRQRLVGGHAHPHGGHRALELLQQVRRVGIARRHAHQRRHLGGGDTDQRARGRRHQAHPLLGRRAAMAAGERRAVGREDLGLDRAQHRGDGLARLTVPTAGDADSRGAGEQSDETARRPPAHRHGSWCRRGRA